MSILDDIQDLFAGYTVATGFIHDIRDSRDWPFAATHGLESTNPGTVMEDILRRTGRLTTPSPIPPVVTPPPPVILNQGSEVNLFNLFPREMWYQSSIGSCTAHGWLAQAHSEGMNLGMMLSRLGLYYWGREAEGNASWDAGMQVRTGGKILIGDGCGTEHTWPYTTSKYKTKPSVAEYNERPFYKLKSYSNLDQTREQFLRCLDSGHTFVGGFECHKSFRNVPKSGSQAGVVPMPGSAKADPLIGWHTVVWGAYKGINNRLYIGGRNSWGTSWGDKGYGWWPIEYLESHVLASDFWTGRMN